MANRPDLEGVILAVLENEPAHGYEISARINRLSGTFLKPGEGQLYPVLHRLEAAGFVDAIWEKQEGRPDRKIYSLTEEGQNALREKRVAWTEFVSAMSPILGEVRHGAA